MFKVRQILPRFYLPPHLPTPKYATVESQPKSASTAIANPPGSVHAKGKQLAWESCNCPSSIGCPCRPSSQINARRTWRAAIWLSTLVHAGYPYSVLRTSCLIVYWYGQCTPVTPHPFRTVAAFAIPPACDIGGAGLTTDVGVTT